MKPIFILLGTFLFFVSNGFSQVQIAGSYLDVTTNGVGGPVSVGDILEVRAVISVPSGTTATALGYTSSVPVGTTYQTGSLKAETNEGVVVPAISNTASYTDAVGDDQAGIQIPTGFIVFYLGTGATSSSGGSLQGGVTTPLFYSSQSILMAVYRVKVNAGATTISLNGTFSYKIGGTINTVPFPTRTISVQTAYTCGTPGANLLTDETNGTFGKGAALNRATASPNVSGFTFIPLSATEPADGYYSVVNNTSPGGGVQVFGVWDKITDHTGNGNGYMLAVNGSYAPASVFSTTISSGITKNTVYTFSFWIYNICPLCGANPATNASSGTPGVKPNLAFQVNGSDYYTSGEITYSGTWVQRSFSFNSGNSTSLTITIINNAPGGGGNDWVVDDINLGTCLMLLPIELINFTGAALPTENSLSWQTGVETKGAGFVVERSTDAASFDSIGYVSALGEPNGSSYLFTDQNDVLNQTLYYRLKLINSNGEISYSQVVPIKRNAEDQLNMHLAPNPTSGGTTLYVNATDPVTSQIAVLSVEGRKMWTSSKLLIKGQNEVEIGSLGHLPAAVYFVTVTTNHQIKTTRLVIQ